MGLLRPVKHALGEAVRLPVARALPAEVQTTQEEKMMAATVEATVVSAAAGGTIVAMVRVMAVAMVWAMEVAIHTVVGGVGGAKIVVTAATLAATVTV